MPAGSNLYKFDYFLWPVAAHVKPAVAKGGDRKLNNPRLIQNRPVWQQVVFLAGGAIANMITAYVVLVFRGLASGGILGGTLGRAIADLWQLGGMLGGHLMSALFGIGASTQPLDFYQQLAFLSLTFGLINLLPLHPFDGGRIAVILRRRLRTQP